jgi:hypothetical protein
LLSASSVSGGSFCLSRRGYSSVHLAISDDETSKLKALLSNNKEIVVGSRVGVSDVQQAVRVLSTSRERDASHPLWKSWTFHSASVTKGWGQSAREKTLAYEWFRILESSRLGSRAKSDDVSAIVDWRSWTIGFIATIGIESDRQIEIRVDAFPLFYELLNAFGDLFAKREFDIEVGEGWSFQGAAADGGYFKLHICFGNDRRIFLSKRIRDRDVPLFLILKTGELASSLEKIDVDLEYFFTKFPIGIYRRGIH